MDIGDLFKQLVWENITKAALNKLFAAIPALSWGPIGYFVTWFWGKLADYVYEEVKLYVNLEYIVFKNKILEKEFNLASVKLKIIARESGIDSEAFRSARDENKKALSNLVRIAG